MVVHCKGGLGRAGTAAALLLMVLEPALDVQTVMDRGRLVLPNAVETLVQEAYLGAQRDVLWSRVTHNAIFYPYTKDRPGAVGGSALPAVAFRSAQGFHTGCASMPLPRLLGGVAAAR